jgi:DNA mismatch endonuclease (patch repair protein)
MGYRRNVRTLPGSPDFANKSKRWAIFVNGCFWHHHKTCARGTIPTRNREFWVEKFAANRRRDARMIAALRAIGFNVAIIWECEGLDPSALASRIAHIAARQNRPMVKRASI